MTIDEGKHHNIGTVEVSSELKKLDPQNNDYSKLKEKKELLSNSEKIKDSITKILQNFNNENIKKHIFLESFQRFTKSCRYS